MSFITETVSRVFPTVSGQKLNEFNDAYLGRISRLSAASAFPQAIAKTIRNSRPNATFKALRKGLARRGITVSKRKMEVWTKALTTIPQKQKRPSDQEERF